MSPPSPSAARPSGTEIVAYIDGASRGNPGPASYGVVIQDAAGVTLDTLSGFIGETTNNVAEYRALLAALEYALSKEVRRLKVYCDSELVAKQMLGRYRVQSPDLRPLFERARALVTRIPHFSIEHLRRERNREADLLANQALDIALNPRAPAPAPTSKIQLFSAVVEEGRLKPLNPLPELEEGMEYEVRACKRTSERIRDR